jgi:hypothetical protein
MRAEIKAKVASLQLEAKEVRKENTYCFFVTIAIITLCIWIVLNYPQYGILILVPLFGGIYILELISSLHQPLESEFYAFQKIAKAIETLENSKEDIFYKEAYRCVNKAYKILKSIELKNNFGLYDWSNEVFKKFLNNLRLIVLPAIDKKTIKIEHLEEIAIAIYETDTMLLNSINKKIEKEPDYKESIIRIGEKISVIKKLKESKYGRVLSSLFFGYGLVLVISLIYVFGTQQDFTIFARENPEILVLGGLAASGIAVWKIK